MSGKKNPRRQGTTYIGPPEQAGQDVYDLVREGYGFSRDLTIALFLDGNREVLGCSVVSIGPCPSVRPAELFKSARQKKATAVILTRIDASVGSGPTADDDRAFQRLQEAGHVAAIRVLDYLVIEEGSWFSFLEQQLF